MSGDFWRKLKLPWQSRADLEHEVDDELAFHVEMRVEELMRTGVDPDVARERVLAEFGDVGATRARYVRKRDRHVRQERSRMLLEDAWSDVRFGARTLAKRPGFALTAVAILALGIGAPATVLTLVSAIFFQTPEHVVEPQRLVRVFRAWEGGGGGSLQHPDYAYYRGEVTTLDGLAAWGGETVAAYSRGASSPSQLSVLFVSDNYFDVLGVPAQRGRMFLAEENRTPGTDPVVVVSHEFWTRALGADQDVVGSELLINGQPFAVVGVAPPGFTGVSPIDDPVDAWTPIAMFGALTQSSDLAWWDRVPNLRSSWLSAIGRLAPGVTLEAAEANLLALRQSLAYDGKSEEETLWVRRQFMYPPRAEATLTNLTRMLLAVVGIVLVIATANVAVLLLSRATTRHREIGIRTALGAGRARLVRQLVAESLLLGLAGGVAGVAIAYLASDLAASALPYAFTTSFAPDARVLGLTAGVALLASIAVGLLPALHSARTDVRSVLQERSATQGGGALRGALVATQVGLSLVLVAGALLFGRSFWIASAQPIGFDADDLLIVRTDLQSLGYGEEEGLALVEEALSRLRALPGVRAASTSRQIPFGGDWSTDIEPPEGSLPNSEVDGQPYIWIGLNAVSPSYFGVTGIDIVRGRALDDGDRADGAPVVVVNEELAGRMWPERDPIGQVIPLRGGMTVVGVARNASYYELGEAPTTQAYASLAQIFQPLISFYVRTEGDPLELAGAVQTTLRDLDASLAFDLVTTMRAVVDDELARYQVSAVLVSLFSLVALALAAAGLYGVVSFVVTQRTREIGVRMALGADRRRVAREVLRSGMRLAALGVSMGLVGAFALRGLTESLLFQGVTASDPLVLGGAAIALVAVTALAAAGPARRATRVDPIEALRTE